MTRVEPRCTKDAMRRSLLRFLGTLTPGLLTIALSCAHGERGNSSGGPTAYAVLKVSGFT